MFKINNVFTFKCGMHIYKHAVERKLNLYKKKKTDV